MHPVAYYHSVADGTWL
ncbi:hypothetical protein R3I94_004649 [Phoxinus phoxinus]